jgi:hypothetical protein
VSRRARARALGGAVFATASALGCGRVESLGPARTTSVEARPAGTTDTDGATDTGDAGTSASGDRVRRPSQVSS